jgi:uncharacterized protein YbjT (DUF2867 family)
MKGKGEKTILVTGATGKQGGAVAKHLTSEGWRVRILTRDPKKAAAKRCREMGMEVTQGDLNDKNSVLKAADGVYGIYSVQSLEQGLEAEVRQGKTLADVAKNRGVRHFVYSSVGAANRNTKIPHFESKWQVEQHIGSLKIPATIFRPVWFMENFLMLQFRDSILKGTLSMPLKPDRTLEMIAVDNIGGFVAKAFENPDELIGQAIDIAGDELTMPQVAEKLGKVIGHDVNFVEMPMEEMRKASEEWAIMFQWFNDVGYKSDISKLRQMLPDLMDFDTWLQKVGREHLAGEKVAVGHASS